MDGGGTWGAWSLKNDVLYTAGYSGLASGSISKMTVKATSLSLSRDPAVTDSKTSVNTEYERVR